MRILVIEAPRLSVQLARRAEPGLRGRPAATVQEPGGEPLVAAVSPEAEAAGVQPGMTLAEARSRCPALAWAPARPGAELHALERLAAVLRRKATPAVAVVSREAVAVDLAGLEGRCADERAAGTALLGLARAWLGLEVRGAVADTVEEGLAAARAARRCLAVCEARGARGTLPRAEGLAVRLAGGVTADRAAAGAERLGQVLAAWGLSCRGLDVTAEAQAGARRWRLRAAGPLHSGRELAALLRPLAGELDGLAEVTIAAAGAGPSFEVAPWRPAAAPRDRAALPARPVERGLALAS
ncbi:hypothetical protein [Tepidiforma thermophila]|uniref:ImpB/mucB/samB family protein n=1 Tax=Tepidiforma thermophila (strain KCTC 52669 / CGMCC 1.13589 / G233) TaxID=2761530 RepID=A0A2A9HCT0_TEPT2|nr:hypothetical protein [Tepidiforma thermophila]PFG72940.1 impB/mucB/samB family protein [Tepidiforma thermophila]